MQKFFIVLYMLLFIQISYACPVGKKGLSRDQLKSLKLKKYAKTLRNISNLNQLPTAGSNKPWGGSDPKKWRAEAIIANAASHWLSDK